MKPIVIQFDPGVAGTNNPLKWLLIDGYECALARFANRDDAELFAEIIKRRPHRSLLRELKP